MLRVTTGAIGRFDSITEMIEFSRDFYGARDVESGHVDGELVLLVRPPAGPPFYSLIVHFDGERRYVVMLPHVKSPVHTAFALHRWNRRRRR